MAEPWTATRERRAIRQHRRRCRFCRALRAYGSPRGDALVATAAERLAADHAANAAEHEAFARPRRASRNAVPKPVELRSAEQGTGTRR